MQHEPEESLLSWSLYWISIGCGIIASLRAFSSISLDKRPWICRWRCLPLPWSRPDPCVLSSSSAHTHRYSAPWSFLIGKVRRRQWGAHWILFIMGLYFYLGGAGEQITEGGVPGFIRERLHCVLLLEQVPETSVQFFGQGWAKLPCHKIIAERIEWNLGFYQRELCVTVLSRLRQDSSPGSSPVNFIMS